MRALLMTPKQSWWGSISLSADLTNSTLDSLQAAWWYGLYSNYNKSYAIDSNGLYPTSISNTTAWILYQLPQTLTTNNKIHFHMVWNLQGTGTYQWNLYCGLVDKEAVDGITQSNYWEFDMKWANNCYWWTLDNNHISDLGYRPSGSSYSTSYTMDRIIELSSWVSWSWYCNFHLDVDLSNWNVSYLQTNPNIINKTATLTSSQITTLRRAKYIYFASVQFSWSSHNYLTKVEFTLE